MWPAPPPWPVAANPDYCLDPCHTYPHNPVDSGITVGIPVNICRQQKSIILFWFEEYGSLIEAYLHFSFPWEDVRFAVRFSV